MEIVTNHELTTTEPPPQNGHQLYHNIRNKHKPHSHDGGNNKRRTYNNRTTSPERTADLSKHEEQTLTILTQWM